MSEDASTLQVTKDPNGANSMDFLALLAIPGVAILYCLLSAFMKVVMAEIRLHGMFVKQGWVVVWRPSDKVDIENPRLPELAGVCACMYVCMYVCMYECMYECMYVCVCVCVCVCVVAMMP